MDTVMADADMENSYHETSTVEKQGLLDHASGVKVYPQRWFMLFLFSMTTMANGAFFIGLSPVSNIVAPYYNTSDVVIEWLSNMFTLIYIFVSLPAAFLMEKYGVRPVLVVASGLNVLSTSLRFSGFKRSHFFFVLGGQIAAAIAFGTILQIPAKLSATWFPENERATATSISVFMNIFGVAVGFLQTTLTVPASSDQNISDGLKLLFLSQLVFCLLIFCLTFCFYKERPLTLPSNANRSNVQMYFSHSLLVLVKDKNFNLLGQSYALYYALFLTITVLLNPLLTTKFPSGYESRIGWMGFTLNMIAILGCFVFGLLLDRYHCYQKVAVFLNASSGVVWLIFILVSRNTNNFSLLYLLITLLGIVNVPFFSTGLEQAAEMTYPVSEGISSAVLLTLANVYACLLILVSGILIEKGHLGIVQFGILSVYICSTLYSCFSKTSLKRKLAEENAETDEDAEADENAEADEG